MSEQTRAQAWDELPQWLLLAKTWGFQAIEALDYNADGVVYTRAKVAAHHAGRALNLLEMLARRDT